MIITICTLVTITVTSIIIAIRSRIKSAKFLKAADQIMVDLSKAFMDAGRVTEKHRIIALLKDKGMQRASDLLTKEGTSDGK
jgi:hypothetical protein